jgi:hypothetical protein
MPVKITIDIFSGRPNPYIILNHITARKVFNKISCSSFTKKSENSPPYPTVLGYRGLIMEQQGKRLSNRLPIRVLFTKDAAYADGKIARVNQISDLVSFVFDHLPSLRLTDNIPSLKKFLESSIEKFELQRPVFIRNYHKKYHRWLTDFYKTHRRTACACAPLPDLPAWNSAPSIQFNNNCYNYSTNYRTDNYGQPGMAAGQQYNDLSACVTPMGSLGARMGALADGLIDLPANNNKCPTTGHLVALVIAPDYDYHWYRKGRNGKWSHKIGGSPATILDNSGNPISDPRTADRGSYVDFCSFMQVIHGHFKIKGPL